MRADRWGAVERLFGESLDQPEAEREHWLREATPSEDLREEVLSLLREHERTEGVLDEALPFLLPGEDTSPSGHLQPGERLGRYEVLGPLASGGMALLYRAYDTTLRREVALKLVAPHLSSNPRSLVLFERETRAVAALAHPNIVAIFDVGQEGSRAFAVLELLRGETLREVVARGPLPLPQALRIGRDVARGLAAAHAAGLVHRDLKPDNVFLTTEGTTKILDFGIARIIADHPDVPCQSAAASQSPEGGGGVEASATGLVGTAGYISPEQARGEPADARSDVFSFGCLLYECLAGQRAFAGYDLRKAVRSVLNDEPPALSKSPRRLPTELISLVDRCLRKDPAQRFASGAELRDAIEPVASKPDASRRRGLRIPFLVGSVVFLVAALGAWGLHLWQSRDIKPATPSGPVFHKNPRESAQMRPVPLTSLEGREFDPALSPDGKQLAFVWDRNQGPGLSLYVVSVGNDAPRRLTEVPGVCCPIWSPDGRSIAFVRLLDKFGELAIIPAGGGPERTLTQLHSWYGTSLAWSGDGKRIAFPDRQADEPYSIVELSLETLAIRKLTQPGVGELGDAFPSYAEDGQSLAFARVSASGDALPADVYVLQKGQVEPTRLTPQRGLIGGLDWAPGSHEIVYDAVLKGQNPRMWRVSTQSGGAPAALDGPMPSETVAESATAVSHALRVSIARSTGAMAYVRRWYDTNIWSISNPRKLPKGDPPQRLIASTRPDESPQYSPDGRRIAFASTRSGSPEIWTCQRNGLGCLPLTHAGVHSGTPRWSPDGRRIAIDSRTGSNSDIHVVAVDSGEMTLVTSSPADEVVPSWSRDGLSIYFGSNRSGIWQVYRSRVDGSGTRQVSVHGGLAAFEGEDLVYFTKYDKPGLWSVPKTGGAESPVLDGPRCWGHWALANDGIYLLDEKPGAGTNLDFFDFSTQRRSTLRTLDQTAPCVEASLALSPESKELLYVAAEESSDIMMATFR